MKTSDRFWQRLIDSVGGIDSSRRLAAGVVMGMMIGLVPKDSMFPYLLGVFLVLSPANLLTGIVSTGLFSILGNLQPLMALFDKLGTLILSNDWVINGIGFCYQFPLLPWLRLENSIVSGSILFCLMMSLPFYLLLEKWFDWQGIQLIRRLFPLPFFRSTMGAGKRSSNVNRSGPLA